MASNDDNPESPPGLTFEDFKKTNKLDFHILQETNPFAGLISDLQDENILHYLRKCILALPAVSVKELEEEADSPKDDIVVLSDLFELVENAKKNKFTSPKETSSENQNFPIMSNPTPDCRSDSPVAYSSSPLPNVETPHIGSLDRASNFIRKRVSSSSFSSRSSDYSHRGTSQTTLSSNNRSSASGSRAHSSYKNYCSTRRHRSYDSRSRSPEDTYYRTKEVDCYKRSHCNRSYDSCRRSPKDSYYHKNEKYHHKGRKSRLSLYRERSSSRGSTDVEDTPHNKKEVDGHKRSRHHRSYNSCRRSPEDTDYSEKEEDSHKRSYGHRSCDSCSRSLKDTYYCKKDDRLKYQKSWQVPFKEKSSLRGSTEDTTSPKKRLKRDASTKDSSILIRSG